MILGLLTSSLLVKFGVTDDLGIPIWLWSHNDPIPIYGKEHGNESESDEAEGLKRPDLGIFSKIVGFLLSYGNKNIILDTSWVLHHFG